MKNSSLTKGEKWDTIHVNMNEAYDFIIEPIVENMRILQTNRSLINCEMIDLMDSLSTSGKDLLSLCRAGIIDVEQLYAKRHKKSKKTKIKPLYKLLKNLGWSRHQIMTSINDLKQVFNIKGETR